MNTIETLHNEAMDLTELAHIAKARDDRDTFLELSKKAFELEKRAALAVSQEFALEPTRSILCRSAASLAMDCTEYREAEKLISLALWGNPPENICVICLRRSSFRGILRQRDWNWPDRNSRCR